MKFQIFVLDQNLIPFNKSKEMDVIITDSNDAIVKHYHDVKTSNFGVYSNSFPIPGNRKPGKWKIRVILGEKTRSKLFEVRYFDKNAIQIDAQTLLDDKQINMNLKIKHPKKNNFTGDFIITVDAYSLKNNKTVSKDLKFHSEFRNLKVFWLLEDLGISSCHSDHLTKFKIFVEDRDTKKNASLITQVILKKEKARNIFLKRKKYFVPGQKFEATVEVRTVDGHPDYSISNLKMKIKYFLNSKKFHEKNSTLNLAIGNALITMNPSENIEKIEIELRADDTFLMEIIKQHPIDYEDIEVKVTQQM